MQEYINIDDLKLFLDLEVIPQIERQKIQWSVPKNRLIKYLIAGTMKYAYMYDRLASSFYIDGPNICHENYEEDNLYWNHLFPSEFWLNIGEKVEKCLKWPPDFSERWAGYLNEWIYNLINPANSHVFQEYYLREPEEEEQDKQKEKLDPYLLDYKEDYN